MGFCDADISSEIIRKVIAGGSNHRWPDGAGVRKSTSHPAPACPSFLMSCLANRLSHMSLVLWEHSEIRLGFADNARKGRPRDQAIEIGRQVLAIVAERHHLAGVEQSRRGGAIGDAERLSHRPAPGADVLVDHVVTRL